MGWLLKAVLLLLLLPHAAGAEDNGKDEALRERLQALEPPLDVTAMRSVAGGQLTEVRLRDGGVLYATRDGSFLVAGDLYRLQGGGVVNETEATRSEARAELLDSVAHEDMIRFQPQGETRAVLKVFTDVTCGFCQRLHQDVPELNAAGVEVQYLAFPRAGVGGDVYRDHVSAWCADDRQTALTRLKAGQSIPQANCDNPVADQYELGQTLGIRGTPALFLEGGRMIPGYRPVSELLPELGL